MLAYKLLNLARSRAAGAAVRCAGSLALNTGHVGRVSLSFGDQMRFLAHLLDVMHVRGVCELRRSITKSAQIEVNEYCNVPELSWHYVVQGGVRVVDAAGRCRSMVAGDIAVMVDACGHRLEPLNARDALERNSAVESRPTEVLSGRFFVSSLYLVLLRRCLPSIVAFSVQGQSTPQLRLSRLIALILDEACDPETGGSYFASNLASALFFMTLRCELANQHSGGGRACEEGYLEPAFDHMFSNPSHDWSAHELALVCQIHESAFLELFMSFTGESVSDFLGGIRIVSAMKMLLESDDVGKVASRVGCNDVEFFEKLLVNKSGFDVSSWKIWGGNRLKNSSGEYV
ncbi:cupin domain-containing protein [Paraburkholderia guartelaensis]|uniref:cupin domain-containing protein n=1 Tax=Paraburkholderia guartelaensis TaxID=2546446 RepID=UPI002AB6845D|nr:cupin domain-containing protein [Paraburkholderia guartelaensis]